MLHDTRRVVDSCSNSSRVPRPVQGVFQDLQPADGGRSRRTAVDLPRHHGWRAPPEAFFFRPRPLATIQTLPNRPQNQLCRRGQIGYFLGIFFPNTFSPDHSHCVPKENVDILRVCGEGTGIDPEGAVPNKAILPGVFARLQRSQISGYGVGYPHYVAYAFSSVPTFEATQTVVLLKYMYFDRGYGFAFGTMLTFTSDIRRITFESAVA